MQGNQKVMKNIEWYLENYIEGRQLIMFLIEEARKKHKVTEDDIFVFCTEVRKAETKKSSLEQHLSILTTMADVGVRASKAGELLRDEIRHSNMVNQFKNKAASRVQIKECIDKAYEHSGDAIPSWTAFIDEAVCWKPYEIPVRGDEVIIYVDGKKRIMSQGAVNYIWNYIKDHSRKIKKNKENK